MGLQPSPSLAALRVIITAPLNPKLQPTQRGAFGAFVWPADFKLSQPAPCDGVIAQHLHIEFGSEAATYDPEDYWEFWNVKKGKTDVSPTLEFPFYGKFRRLGFDGDAMKGSHNDWFSYSGPGVNSPGSVKFDGTVWFVEGAPPGPFPGQQVVKVGDASQLVIPSSGGSYVSPSLFLSNDVMLRLWVMNKVKSLPATHLYQSKWVFGGSTTVIDHRP